MTDDLLRQILIVSDNEGFINETTLFFKGFDDSVKYSFHGISFEQAVRYSLDKAPALVLMELDQHDEEIFTLTRKIASHFPLSKIVGVGTMLSVETVLRLLKYGAQDFLKYPYETEEVRSLFFQIGKETEPEPTEKTSSGKSITVLSSKGGAGVTFLTTNLAVALAEKNPDKSIGIVDLRPQCGDVTTYLNLKPEYTIRDIVDNIDQIDHAFLEGVTLKHESGIHVFASPRDDQEPINANCLSELREVLSFLQQMYDILLIDGCYVDELLLETVLLHSDRILLMGNLDVPSLKGLISALNKFAKYQFDLEKVGIVINRFNSKNQIDAKDFEKKTGHKIACHLPNDYALCIESINRGVPVHNINAGANISQKINELATLIQKSEFDEKIIVDKKRGGAVSLMKKSLFGWLL